MNRRLRRRRRSVSLIADVFNIFNRQMIADYNNWIETTFGSLNPDSAWPAPRAWSRGSSS